MHASDATATVPQVEVLVTEALTAAVLPRWQPLLTDAAALRPRHLVVDLTGCTRLDAAGIELLVQVHRCVWADGGRLTLRGMSTRLYRLLEVARVDRVLQTAPAPPGYAPQHHLMRSTSGAPQPDRPGAAAPGDEVRWWEAVPSGG
jgi:anti-anti-sigma factor